MAKLIVSEIPEVGKDDAGIRLGAPVITGAIHISPEFDDEHNFPAIASKVVAVRSNADMTLHLGASDTIGFFLSANTPMTIALGNYTDHSATFALRAKVNTTFA